MNPNIREEHTGILTDLITVAARDIGFTSLQDAKIKFAQYCQDGDVVLDYPEYKFFSILRGVHVSRFISDTIYLYADDASLNRFYTKLYQTL